MECHTITAPLSVFPDIMPAGTLTPDDSPLRRCCRDVMYVVQFAFRMENSYLKGCMGFRILVRVSPEITRLLVWDKLMLYFNLALI